MPTLRPSASKMYIVPFFPKRVRQRMSAVFVHGISTSARSANPAGIVVKALKPQPKKTPQPAITDIEQLREFPRTIEAAIDVISLRA